MELLIIYWLLLQAHNMSTTISVGTTTGTAFSVTPDTSGNLAFQTQAGANTITLPNATGTIALSYTPITNSLGADVSLTNGVYVDGPSVAQGTTGTWFASGTVTVRDPSNANSNYSVKLWDGTTVIASCRVNAPNANGSYIIVLSGYLASPAGNLRISVNATTYSGSSMLYNSSGNSKDCTISAFRIA